MLFGGNTKFTVEGVMPNFLHIIPVGDNAMFDRVLNLQNTAFLLGLITDVYLFLIKTHHNSWHLGPSYDR